MASNPPTPPPVEQQYTKVRTKAWFASMQTTAMNIVNGLSNMGARSRGPIDFVIDTVPVTVTYTDNDLDLQIGDGGSGQPLYDVKLPRVWMS